jgi:hypothetical protein
MKLPGFGAELALHKSMRTERGYNHNNLFPYKEKQQVRAAQFRPVPQNPFRCYADCVNQGGSTSSCQAQCFALY